jgi:3-phenylpropionate/trans-cinnamate dioxygenase ferredoxin reductase component
MQRLVIVGASLSGLRAAQSARRDGFEGSIVVIGDEPHLPYNRPPLSKEVLHGKQSHEQTMFPLGELDVDWRLGTAAVSLDRDAHEVVLADGTRIGYDRLIAATGCRARQWQGPGSELDGVHTLRTLDDAARLQAELLPGRKLVIVGAGFIGCEIAASARGLGVEVALVDIAPHPMLPLGPELGERWLRMHRENGVEVLLGAGIEALHGSDGHVTQVELTDGTRLAADVVLMGLGSQLNIEWLEGSGLQMNPAVVTDATLTSSDPDILAVGDIAAVPVPLADGDPLRIEHWTTAAEHGQLAGRNALVDPAERKPHEGTPYFWSDQYGIKIQAIGLPAKGLETELIEQSEDGERLVAARVAAGRVVGVVAINAAKRLIWYRKLLSSAPELDELKAMLAEEDSAFPAPPAGATL